jgi:hypothetical protein
LFPPRTSRQRPSRQGNKQLADSEQTGRASPSLRRNAFLRVITQRAFEPVRRSLLPPPPKHVNRRLSSTPKPEAVRSSTPTVMLRVHGVKSQKVELFTNPVRTSQETPYVSATGPNRLMLFGETVAGHCENHTEHTNAPHRKHKTPN